MTAERAVMTLPTAEDDIVAERRARSRRAWSNRGMRLGAVALALLVWEIAGHFTPRLFLQPFHETVRAFGELALEGPLLTATLSSLWVLTAGLAISVVLGVVLGLAMGRYKRAQWALEPYVNGLYATPTVALLPLLTLWMGLYAAPKIAIVVLIAVFPIIKNTHVGVTTVSHELLEPAASMGASELQTFTRVIMPATVPYIMTGLRLGVGRGIVGVVVGEFFTAQSGLGGLLVRYASSFKTAEMFVPIIVLVAIGYGLTALTAWGQRRLAPWKETDRDQGL
jgi:ABC-type nitrate/sulfonate/bicarbonate transport system permease component